MRKFIAVVVVALLSTIASADGTITVQPTSDPPATWQIRGISINPSTPPTGVIDLVWLTQSGREIVLDDALYPRTITLASSELASFIGAISPAGADTFSGTGAAAKRFRQRVTKWLIDNGKLSRAANE